jgi:type II secretory pathway pseudopilin PulG
MAAERKADDAGARRGGARDGMTFIEVLIAVLIFGFCIAGMCALVLSSKKLSDQARNHYVAVNIAKNRIERTRNLDFSGLLALYQETNVFGNVSGVQVDGNGNPTASGDYCRRTEVKSVAGKTNLLEVIVTVYIKDPVSLSFGGENESVSTYITDLR